MIAKITSNWTSFQGNGNQQISFCEIPQTKRGKQPPGRMRNMFFYQNLSKLCAEGAIQNLLNMLHFLPEDMIFGGELATSDLFTLMKSLNESFVPKAV